MQHERKGKLPVNILHIEVLPGLELPSNELTTIATFPEQERTTN